MMPPESSNRTDFGASPNVQEWNSAFHEISCGGTEHSGAQLNQVTGLARLDAD
jgi:hypothetical protein